MKLNELLTGVKTEKIYNEANPEITDVCYNSSKAVSGSVFVAIEGFKTDGHKYAADAVERGAAAVIALLSRVPAVRAFFQKRRVRR